MDIDTVQTPNPAMIRAEREYRQAVQNLVRAAGDLKEFLARRASSGSPGISSDSTRRDDDVSDPRCDGRETDSERGTLFTNPDFCGGSDIITCLRKQEDGVYAATGGFCYTEIGHDDRPMIVCNKIKKEKLTTSPDGDVAPTPEGGENDHIQPKTHDGKIATQYIKLTQFGAFWIGFCAHGGCPDPIPYDRIPSP